MANYLEFLGNLNTASCSYIFVTFDALGIIYLVLCKLFDDAAYSKFTLVGCLT